MGFSTEQNQFIIKLFKLLKMIKSQLKIFINTIPKCGFKNVTSNVYFPLMLLPALGFKINVNTQCKKHFRENQSEPLEKKGDGRGERGGV